MERKDHTRTIQGGGCGVGFKAPRSLIYAELRRLHEICGQIALQAENGIKKYIDENEINTV